MRIVRIEKSTWAAALLCRSVARLIVMVVLLEEKMHN